MPTRARTAQNKKEYNLELYNRSHGLINLGNGICAFTIVHACMLSSSWVDVAVRKSANSERRPNDQLLHSMRLQTNSVLLLLYKIKTHTSTVTNHRPTSTSAVIAGGARSCPCPAECDRRKAPCAFQASTTCPSSSLNRATAIEAIT